MAETLTYDPGTSEQTNTENLSQEEQESLKVGEQLVEQQEQLLAGKYKDAEELEKAYVELQKKLGEKSTEDSEDAGDTESSDRETDTEEEEETEEVSPAAELITSASEEFEESGKLTPETMAKFSEMSSKDLVEAYMEIQSNLPQDTSTDEGDITDAQVNQIRNFAGGEQAYSNIVNWASQNLDQQSIEAFDSIVNSGSVEAIKRLAAAQGIDVLNLIKTPEQLEQDLLQRQQEYATQSLTDQAGQLASTPLMDASKDPDAKDRIDALSQAIQPPQ